LVLINGGLGPTPDDLTREALAEALGRRLLEDADSLRRIRSLFEQWQRPMPAANERQAWLPEGAQAIENARGTAPGIEVKLGSSRIFAMPGVPKEMMAMFEQSIEPTVAADGAGAIVTRTLNCFGASEANIAGQIEDLMRIGREPTVGITACEGVIGVRVFARGDDAEAAQAAAEIDAAEVRRRLGPLIFGEQEQTLQEAVATLLFETCRTVSVAESCTGGLLAKRLTDVPGSSDYFLGGLVTYANEAKVAQLAVAPELIERHGAVSEEVAQVMAEGCRIRFDTDYALSVTGIAGPGGGTPDKPVGLVYIGLADVGRCDVERRLIGEHLDRASIRDRICKVALNLLRRRLMETEARAPQP
jgi:nicotinamide-nucleotide amidase